MVTVLIVTDTELYRGVLTEILSREHGLRAFGTTGSCEEVVECMHEMRADVVLVDMSMPECVTTISAIRRVDPSITVVAFALRDVDHEVLAHVETVAAAWVPPTESLRRLLDTIFNVAGDKPASSPRSVAR